jgi:hypothetical protein
MPAEVGVARGCGDSREEGGFYLEVDVGPFGLPFDGFILDPISELHPDDLLAIPRLGVTLVEGPDGITHVIDWVGETHYPFATDFLEEGRRKGFSRKLSKLVEIQRLEPGKSFIYFLHARGFLQNWQAYDQFAPTLDLGSHCHEGPGRQLHPTPPNMHCCRYLWAAAKVNGYDAGVPLRGFVDFTYAVFPPVEPVVANWSAAYVARFPITNFTVIRSKDNSHQATLANARQRSRYAVLEADA